MIVTITGASASGKTTLQKYLLNNLANSKPIVSITSRNKRDSDNEGEYIYLSKGFLKFVLWLESKIKIFLWTVEVHGNWYGTLRWSVNKALKNYDDVSIMILTPDAVRYLRKYANAQGSEEFITSFFILSPPTEILRKRLTARGDSEFDIATRIKDCEKWDSEAKRAEFMEEIPYVFVSNEGEIQDAANQIIEEINDRKGEDLF